MKIVVNGETIELEASSQAPSTSSKLATITLTVDDWDEDHTQTISLPDTLNVESNRLIIPIPTESDDAAVKEADLTITDYTATSLTFFARNLPEDDLTINVFAIEASAVGNVANIPTNAIFDGALGRDLSKDILTKEVTRAEYDALSDEEKKNTLYLVKEPPWMPTAVSIQDYDTDDGWHIRKYSDGYVEMSYKKDYSGSATMSWDNGYATEHILGVSYPITLVKCYSMQMYPIVSHDVYITQVGTSDHAYSELTKTPTIRLKRPVSTNNISGIILYHITGRWK